MLTLLVALIALAIIAYIARAVLRGLGAPGWMDAVVIGLVLLVALFMVANALGVATPALR